MSLKLFVDDYRLWLLCLITSHHKSCVLLIALIRQLILEFAPVFVCWYIICTNMNYKMMRVFSKRGSDVVLHTFYHCTGKTVHMYLTVFQWMWESYPVIGLTMLSPRIMTFLVNSGVSSFHAIALGRLLPSFIDNCFCLVWSWIDANELSQIWFYLLILLVKLPFMFVFTTLLPFVLLPIVLLSVLKSSLLFSTL